MAALSAGPIAAIAVACSVISAILAGAIVYWKVSRSCTTPMKPCKPWQSVFRYLTSAFERQLETVCAANLQPFLINNIDKMVCDLVFTFEDTPVPPALIAALKAAVPCDGVVGADWPLWERLMTDTKHKNFHNNRYNVLCVIIAHWLVPKMQADGDENMTLLPPDFVSLRKRIMAKPQYRRPMRAVQQFWSYLTMSLQWQPMEQGLSWQLPTAPDCRATSVLRVRDELFQLLEPWIRPGREQNFRQRLDDVIALATTLASTLLYGYFGEAELYWADPKTERWPEYAEERLEDDDYFLLRFPGIRFPKHDYYGRDIDDATEPERVGGNPPPKRDWIRLEMDETQRPNPTDFSIGGRLSQRYNRPLGAVLSELNADR